jgi:8-oxo-dGTP pyrophosphatase MutT (NUDIX family)
MEDNPWVRLSRRVAYENKWIRVLHDEVTRPDGQPGIYGVVSFLNRAIGVVAIDERDRVLLVGQYRYPLDQYSWEIPEGGAPRDEDPLAGAISELKEETGFRAHKWTKLGVA